ncbi:MAG: LD-carboxypeptidase [Eubacteriales bacterium]|nr:LD-carboxypeptidase [Eubacteriales bacterium]
MRFPERLKKGDVIALAAFSFPVKENDIELCARWIEQEGYQVKISRCLAEEKNIHGYLAGDERSRAQDLQELFEDRQVKGIFCIRGGYGSAQLMKYLDFERIKENPKVFVGYSDVTNLHIVLNQFCDLVTFHGPMIYNNFLKKEDVYTKDSLYQAIEMGEKMEFQNPNGEKYKVIQEGEAQGIITGGNMTVLSRGIGTFFQVDTKDKILFLEEVDETIPSIDMMITQMEYAGLFREVKGILFGSFKGCSNERYDSSYHIDEFLRDRMKRYRIPMMSHIASGHETPMGTIPMGAKCRMDTEKNRILFSRSQEKQTTVRSSLKSRKLSAFFENITSFE